MSWLDTASNVAFKALVNDIDKLAGNEKAITLIEDSLPSNFKGDCDPFIDVLIKFAGDLSFGQSVSETQSATGKLQNRRLNSLIEQIRLNSTQKQNYQWVYPLKPLSAKTIFPEARSKIVQTKDQELQATTRLWRDFKAGLEAIPLSHKRQPSLWLDHFDSLWQTYTLCLPSFNDRDVNDEVSLYDHSKTTAALAVALWRWHQDSGEVQGVTCEDLRSDGSLNKEKFLLVQGDFFGIQNFIFTNGSDTQKASAKLLRGRSFYVSLLSELAALKILEALELPSTSQIINAAGKFLIVAANTPETIEKLKIVQDEIDQWFIKETLATSGIGLAWTAVSCRALISKTVDCNFSELINKLFEVLEVKKLQSFKLTQRPQVVLDPDYSEGVSTYDDRLPKTSLLPDDQISIGERLVKNERILVLNSQESVREGLFTLKLPIFGFTIGFVQSESVQGKFGEFSDRGILRRCWDYSMPLSMDEILWHGYARRNINGYVARFNDEYEADEIWYQGVAENVSPGSLIKSFAHLSCEDRELSTEADLVGGRFVGQVALTALKGDIDSLGLIFQKGLNNPSEGRYNSFAKMASLSRQINQFFTIYLPRLCAEEFPNTYTVFAGGDDFFLLGPWYQTQKLAYRLQQAFELYVQNPEVHFSCGLAMVKPNVPIRTIARMAEESLDSAKQGEKNAVTCFGVTVPWRLWPTVESTEHFFQASSQRFGIGNSYLYSLFSIIDMAQNKLNPEASIWRSRLFYKTVRLAKDKHDEGLNAEIKDYFLPELVGKIETQAEFLRIPLSNYFYKNRRN